MMSYGSAKAKGKAAAPPPPPGPGTGEGGGAGSSGDPPPSVGPPRPEPSPPPIVTGPPIVAPPPVVEDADDGIMLDPGPAPPAPEKTRAVGKRRFADKNWMAGLGDALVHYDGDWKNPAGELKPNWRLACPRHGLDCQKSRFVVPANMKRFGMVEIVAFLHAWIPVEVPEGSTASHAKQNPTPAQVAAMVDENREELEAIVQRAGL